PSTRVSRAVSTPAAGAAGDPGRTRGIPPSLRMTVPKYLPSFPNGSGLADYQLGRGFLMTGAEGELFYGSANAFHHHGHRGGAHRLHGLAHGGEWRNGDGGGCHIVETDHRTLFRHAHSSFMQRPQRPKSRHVVKCHKRGEAMLTAE